MTASRPESCINNDIASFRIGPPREEPRSHAGRSPARGRAADRRSRRIVTFRIPERALEEIDRAAERTHQDRTSFVLGAAVEKAGEVLRDQTVFLSSDEGYDRFAEALDNPPRANERLRALVRKKPLWERP